MDDRIKLTINKGKKNEYILFLEDNYAESFILKRQMQRQFNDLAIKLYRLCLGMNYEKGLKYIEEEIFEDGAIEDRKLIDSAREHWYRFDKPRVRIQVSAFIESIDEDWRIERRREFLLRETAELREETRRIKDGFKKLQEKGAESWVLDIYNERNPFDIPEKKLNRYENELYMVQNRITPELIEDAREISVKDVVGAPTRRVGQLEWAMCPFHDDKKPSMAIYPPGKGFHCFACGEGGSVIDFIMKRDNMSFVQAVTYLKPYA